MPLIRERTGQLDERGRPVYNYRQEPLDASKPVVMTGPINGNIELADGTSYNVSDDYIEVASMAHAGELSHHIGVQHEQDGHPDYLPPTHPDYNEDEKFRHVCTEHCGAAATTAPVQETI